MTSDARSDEPDTGRDDGPTAADFRDGVPFLGGRQWIDLVNTRPALGTPPTPVDLIGTPAEFARWTALAGLPAPADGDHGRAHELRAAFDALFATLGTGGIPDAIPKPVERALADARFRLDFRREATGFQARERLIGGPVEALAVDFARFACDYEPARLKRCANPDCTMVFYDRGKNNRRRWCTMSLCGNRDKVARFRSRQMKAD